LDVSHKELKPHLFKFIISQGWQIDKEKVYKELEGSPEVRKEIMFDIYNKLPEDELNNYLDWYNIDGDIIYKVLGLRNYERWKTRIISDLDDGFEKFYLESSNKFLQKYGSSGEILPGWINLKEFIRNSFISIALSIAIEYDNPESIRLARKYINSEDPRTKQSAIRIIDKYGDLSDAQALVNVCLNSYGTSKNLAANAALKLKPGLGGVPTTFLLTNDYDLIKLALKSLRNEPITKTKKVVETLLKNDHEYIRSQAILYLIDMLPKEELVDTLTSYPNNIYYYNVVCWLDRMLYANSPLKEVYRKRLEKGY
jgi:hypothetical protein